MNPLYEDEEEIQGVDFHQLVLGEFEKALKGFL